MLRITRDRRCVPYCAANERGWETCLHVRTVCANAYRRKLCPGPPLQCYKVVIVLAVRTSLSLQ